MKKSFQEILLTIKYWLQGQDWKPANECARVMVYGFKNQGRDF